MAPVTVAVSGGVVVLEPASLLSTSGCHSPFMYNEVGTCTTIGDSVFFFSVALIVTTRSSLIPLSNFSGFVSTRWDSFFVGGALLCPA